MVWEGVSNEDISFCFLNISFCGAETFRFADYNCGRLIISVAHHFYLQSVIYHPIFAAIYFQIVTFRKV